MIYEFCFVLSFKTLSPRPGNWFCRVGLVAGRSLINSDVVEHWFCRVGLVAGRSLINSDVVQCAL